MTLEDFQTIWMIGAMASLFYAIGWKGYNMIQVFMIGPLFFVWPVLVVYWIAGPFARRLGSLLWMCLVIACRWWVKKKAQLWRLALRNHPTAVMLPKRLYALRWVLFPIDSFFWHMKTEHSGYNPFTDTWTINGVQWSGGVLHELGTLSDGAMFRISRDGAAVVFERVSDDHE